jgi:hypothetical protein
MYIPSCPPTPPPRTRPRGHHQQDLRGQQRAAGVPYLPGNKGGPVYHWQADLPGGLFQALYRYHARGQEDGFTHQHGESHVLAVSTNVAGSVDHYVTYTIGCIFILLCY